MFIQITGNIVSRITAKKVQAYLIKFAKERFLKVEVRNLINDSNRISENSLYGLDMAELEFKDYTPESQFFHCLNTVLEVRANEVIEHNPRNINQYVWEDEVINHTIRRIKPSFFITQQDNNGWYLELKHQTSNLMNVLINTSRIHWRKEFEDQFKDNLQSDEAKAYRLANKFNLSGDYLTEEQRKEQRLHFINKVFALGYLLHRQKAENRTWCIFAMDNQIGDGHQNNGGSGKSLTMKAPRLFMRSVTLNGANPKIVENNHIYENVSEHTDYLLVDDADKYLPFRFFYNNMTGDMTINPKNTGSFELPFEKTPKLGYTSNYTVGRFDASTERRILYMVFGDYYHQKTESNGYLESRSVYDDFGKNLFGYHYTEEEWNADTNFLIDCTQFYLSTIHSNVKIQPPMDNVRLRNLLAIMEDAFFDWAEVYFDPSSGNLDRLIAREEAKEDFVRISGLKAHSTNKFSEKLAAYSSYKGYSYNPESFRNKAGNIVRKHNGVAAHMIYLQSISSIIIDEDDADPF